MSAGIDAFNQLLNNYSTEYSADRSLAEEQKQEEKMQQDVEGQELLNLGLGSSLGVLHRGVQGLKLNGKIGKYLDDYESGLSPRASRAFRITRQVASNLLGQAPHVQELNLQSALKPLAPGETRDVGKPLSESLPSISIKDQIVPKLREIGNTALADALDIPDNVNKDTINAAYEALKASPAGQQLADAMLAAKNAHAVAKGAIDQVQSVANEGLPSLEGEAYKQLGGVQDLVAGKLQQQVAPEIANRLGGIRDVVTAGIGKQLPSSVTEGDFGDRGLSVKPSFTGDLDEFSDNPAASVRSLGAFAAEPLAIAGGFTSGRTGMGLTLGALGSSIVADPTNAIGLGAQIATQQLPVSQQVKTGLSLSQIAGQTAYGLKDLAPKSLVQTGEAAADKISTGLTLPDSLTGAAAAGEDVAGIASGIAAKVGETTAGDVADALLSGAEASLAADEDPVGGIITGLLGLGGAVASAVEGLKDLFDSPSAPALPKLALPSLQAGAFQ